MQYDKNKEQYTKGAKEGSARIGNAMQALRKEHGKTQEEMAKLIGCQRSVISDYERNIVKVPAYVVAKYSEILGEPIQLFFEPLSRYPTDEVDDEEKAGCIDRINLILPKLPTRYVKAELNELLAYWRTRK